MKIKHATNMKTNRILRNSCAAALSAALLFALEPASHAANLVYYVTLNVASLQANPDAPFSLDLQLQTGSANATTGAGNVTNTVALSNFVFLNGSATVTPNFTSGGETGSFANTVTLTNSSSTNEFAAAFNSQVTQISFKVTQTTNSEVATGPITMDQFNVLIDDNNTGDGFVPTTAPGGADVNAFSSTSSPDPGVTASITAIPEPRSTAMLCLGGALLSLWGFRRKNSKACA
jgi:hypothetical protein